MEEAQLRAEAKWLANQIPEEDDRNLVMMNLDTRLDIYQQLRRIEHERAAYLPILKEGIELIAFIELHEKTVETILPEQEEEHQLEFRIAMVKKREQVQCIKKTEEVLLKRKGTLQKALDLIEESEKCLKTTMK